MTKTALVTGASSGIGYELAKLLAKDGYGLVLVARNENRLNEIKKDFEQKYSVSVKVLIKDLSKPSSALEIFDSLKSDHIDVEILINNAGFGQYGFFVETDLDKETQMIQTNVLALHQLTKLFLKEMVKRKSGRILNVSSTAAFQPGPLMAVYYATKAYVQSFTEALANEVKGTGVTVTALCPGPTESGFQAAASLENSRLVKIRKLPSSEEVAQFGYRAMMQGKVIAIHGIFNNILVFLIRFVPRNFVTFIVRKVQKLRK